MKNKIKGILKQELTWAYIGLFVCLVFAAVGVGLIIVGFRGGGFQHVTSAIFICVIAACFWGFAVF